MGKKIKKKKIKRKVTILKYNDRSDGLIISKTITTREELTVKVQYKSKNIKFNKKEYKRRQPIMTSLIRERIIPSCFRANCRYHRNNHANISMKGHYDCKGYTRENARRQQKKSTPIPIIDISDDDWTDNVIEYENISSGSFSSISDDEIDTLLASTRKRMRDLDTEWTLLPRQLDANNDLLSKSVDLNQSMCSLDTLILETENEEYLVNNIKNETYSPTLSPDRLNNEFIETNKTNIKLEYPIKNENNNHDFSCNNAVDIKLDKDICLPLKNHVTEVNNNNMESLFINSKPFIETGRKQNSDEKYIEAVVTKLEKEDMKCLSNTNIYSIKQEIYSDI